MSILDAKITEVYEQQRYKNKLGPVSVSFEHADLNLGTKDDPMDLSIFKPKMKKTGETDKGMEVKAKMMLGKVAYSNHAPSVKRLGQDPHRRKFLAIRNKKTNEMMMYEMQDMYLGPHVKHPESTNPMLRDETDAQRSDRKSMKKHLVSKFGQAKGQRIFAQSDRMKIDESQTEKKITRAASNMDLSDIALPADMTLLNLVPPQNRAATSIEDVYDFNDILSEEERAMGGDTTDQQFLSKYPKIKDIVDSTCLSEMTKVIATKFYERNVESDYISIMYLDQMIKLCTTRAKFLDKGPKRLDPMLPMPLREKLWNTFTVQNRFSPESKDRCICYIIVIGLLLNDFELPLDAVLKDLKLKQSDKLKRLMQHVGGSIQKDNLTGKSFIVIKIPLTKYDANTYVKKKKK